MVFKNTQVFNFEGAFRGLRNPLESWGKSDSEFGIGDFENDLDWFVGAAYCEEKGIKESDRDLYFQIQEEYAKWLRDNGIVKINHTEETFEYAYIGPKDMDLAHRMIKAGTSDSKFLRQIFVSVDITAPLYWWKEFDTYKIGTVANSTSTMHKLASTPITKDCFELDDFTSNITITEEDNEEGVFSYFTEDFMDDIINNLEILRIKYLQTKDKKYWKELIRWLPNGWLQTRTVTLNYAVLRNIYFQREHHKLTEWHRFCEWVQTLPYAMDLILYTGKEEN